MPKSLITLAGWLSAWPALLTVFRRLAMPAVLPALPASAFRHANPRLLPAPLRAASSPIPHALAATAGACLRSARGMPPWANPVRGASPGHRARPDLPPGRACSTTAFGLFDATRERGMGHPAG